MTARPARRGPRYRVVPVSFAAAAALAEVHRQCFDNAAGLGEAWDADAFADILQVPGTVAFAARGKEEELNGVAVVRVTRDEAELLTLGVIPGARREGVGKALLARAVRAAAARGARRLFLEVAESNEAARTLYREEGFADVGYRRGYYAVRVPGVRAVSALVMMRQLAPARNGAARGRRKA